MMIKYTIKPQYKILALTFLSFFNFSCKEDIKGNIKNQFIQPTVLSKNSAFDFTKLTFNENADQLMSKSLDTTDIGFSGKNYEAFLFGNKVDWKNSSKGDRYFEYPEKRYIFKTKETDSIGQFDSTYFNRIIIETNPEKKITALIGKTKFEHKKDLDTLLKKIFKRYGKTSDMQEYDRHNAEVDAEVGKNMTPAQREMMKQGDPIMDYAAYLLDYGDEGYREWKLKDRVIQVSITKDREISVSTDAKENYNIEYFYVNFLIIRRDEYDTMGKEQLKNASMTKKALIPYKFYEINAYDPSNNLGRYAELEKAWSKT